MLILLLYLIPNPMFWMSIQVDFQGETMSLIQAALLGLVQGLTEFLPVSSSGHLVLVRKLFGWSDDGGLVIR